MSDRAEVEGLPRRTAHALHALVEATRELNMPPTAAEATLYDGEAVSPRATAAALNHARRRGYCFCLSGNWWAETAALDLRSALEDRYLRETEREDDG